MSWRATSWAAEQRTGSPISKLVLFKLSDNSNDEGLCWPSVPLIAEQTELSERTVQEHLKRLEGLGLITIERRISGGVNLPNHYHLAMPAPSKRSKVVQDAHHGDGAAGAPPVQAATGGGAGAAPWVVQDTASHIEEPSLEPSMNPHSVAREAEASLRAKVWPAFEQWPGLPATASEAKTLAALDRMTDQPPLGDLLDCIDAHRQSLEAENLRRGSAGATLSTAPHNWLTRDRGWEKYLAEVRSRPARIADGVERTARVMATLGAEVHARLRRARLNEGEIAALDGVEFTAGDPPVFLVETLQQENILRKHHPELNDIWPGLRIERGERKTA